MSSVDRILELEADLQGLRAKLDAAERAGDDLRFRAIDQEMRGLDEHRQRIKLGLSGSETEEYELRRHAS